MIETQVAQKPRRSRGPRWFADADAYEGIKLRTGDVIVESPRGGMNIQVAYVWKDGDVLATEDGLGRAGGWCECDDGGRPDVYYEFVQGAGRGYHGWLCGVCRGIQQTG